MSQLSVAVMLAQTLKSTQAMADAMRGATKAMGAMNKQMNLPALTKIMREFERQNEKMEMTSEMMGDAVDDAFEVDPQEQSMLHVHAACKQLLGAHVWQPTSGIQCRELQIVPCKHLLTVMGNAIHVLAWAVGGAYLWTQMGLSKLCRKLC